MGIRDLRRLGRGSLSRRLAHRDVHVRLGDGLIVGPQAGAIAEHTYAKAGTFTVTVTVVDTASLMSQATATPNVERIVTTIGLRKRIRSGRILVNGAASPNQTGRRVSVTLLRRKAGRFVKIATHRPSLSTNSTYRTWFRRPPSGTCKLVSRLAANDAYRASTTKRIFSC